MSLIEIASDPLAEAAINLEVRWACTQYKLAGAVLADVRKLAPFAASIGVRRHHFHDDCLIIYSAMLEHREKPVVEILAAARIGLKAAHFWDDTQIPGNEQSSLWSDRRLVHLALAWPGSKAAVRFFASKLINIYEHLQQARQQYEHLLKTLQCEHEPYRVPAEWTVAA